MHTKDSGRVNTKILIKIPDVLSINDFSVFSKPFTSNA